MPLRHWSILAAVAAAAWFQATAFATVIFDNTIGSGHGITTTGFPLLGGQVTAAPGTPRTVIELDIGFTYDVVPATADLQAFLYANDGGGLPGALGTLLWQSAVMSGVSIDSTNLLIPFAVPSIVVPDSFSYAASITNASSTVGYAPAFTATVGTYNRVVAGYPSFWVALPSIFQVEARVVAASVPEPATLALLSLGLAGLGFSRRRAAPINVA